MAEKGCLKDGIFNNLEVGGLLLGKNVELTSKTSQEPVLTLENTTNDANGAILKFVKDKGAAGAADDVNGLIQFFGDDANQDQVMFSELKSQVKVHTNGQEGGKLTFSVAEHDGTSTAGLTIEDGDADGELDVTIGAGTASLTTVAGNILVTGNTTSFGNGATIVNTSAEVLTITEATTALSGHATIGGNLLVDNIQGKTDGTDTAIKQFDAIEVARVHDGGNLPGTSGTSPTVSSLSTGFGYRRRVIALGSGNNDNVLQLAAGDSGCVVAVTPTNNITVKLPLIGTDLVGFWFTLVTVATGNKDVEIHTSGTDNADTFLMQCCESVDTGTRSQTSDISGSKDVLTVTNPDLGTTIECLCVKGGNAEVWIARTVSTGTVATTLSNS